MSPCISSVMVQTYFIDGLFNRNIIHVGKFSFKCIIFNRFLSIQLKSDCKNKGEGILLNQPYSLPIMIYSHFGNIFGIFQLGPIKSC